MPSLKFKDENGNWIKIEGATGATGPIGATGVTGATGNTGDNVAHIGGIEPTSSDKCIWIDTDEETDSEDLYLKYNSLSKEFTDHINTHPEGPYSFGEKVIIDYKHTANPVLEIENINWGTGEITFKKEHGLTGKVSKIILRPKDFTTNSNFMKDLEKIPIEYSKALIGFQVIDSKRVTIIDTSTNLAVTVNQTVISNNLIDFNAFVFEIPKGWRVDVDTNLIKTNLFTIKITGYSAGQNHYRYKQIYTKNKDGVLTEQQYINPLGTGSVGLSNVRSCIYTVENYECDYSGDSVIINFTEKLGGRREGYDHVVFDYTIRNNYYCYVKAGGEEHYFTRLQSHAMERYAYLSNGTRIQIIAKGGILNG